MAGQVESNDIKLMPPYVSLRHAKCRTKLLSLRSRLKCSRDKLATLTFEYFPVSIGSFLPFTSIEDKHH